MNHNKHVLCEKPLGVNLKEETIMIEKAAEKQLFLMEVLWSRFLPNRITEILEMFKILGITKDEK